MIRLEAVILGCGSSAGVPRADGTWGACDPAEPRNRRSRCSLLVRRPGEGEPTTLVIDAAPEFRLQMNAAEARRLDALLLTHDHADQCHGIDDIRAFAIVQRAKIPVWMDAATAESLGLRFDYLFFGKRGYPPVGDIQIVPPHGEPWSITGPSGPVPITTFDQDHGEMRSVGYRFGGVAYSSDVVELSEEAFEALADLDVWIVDALRWTPHPTHAHVDKTLAWIERVKPKRAILTNLHFDLDFAELGRQLPRGVEPAYDGMTLQFTAESE